MAMAPSSPRPSSSRPSSQSSSSSSSSEAAGGSSTKKRQLIDNGRHHTGGHVDDECENSNGDAWPEQHQQPQSSAGEQPQAAAAAATTSTIASTSTAASSNTRNAAQHSSHSAYYRLHFSCQHVGKYRRSTKRRLEWKFGFTNLQAAREGKSGVDCRGEEHEIQLIWSVLSGKIRVYWNKSDITHLFRESREEHRERVDISWEARSGATFQILARDDHPSDDVLDGQQQQETAVAPPPISSSTHSQSPSHRQYDLLVDGQSFFSFSHISDLVFPTTEIIDMHTFESLEGPGHKAEERSDDASSLGYDVRDACFARDPEVDNLGLRLSMAGFVSPPEQTKEGGLDDLFMDDDLTSPSMSNTLESLRARIIEMIPFADTMLSRSLVLALSEDISDSGHSLDSSSSSFGSSIVPSTNIQIEAEILRDAVDWINNNVQCAPRPDVEDQKRDFLQRQMDTVFLNARNERLSLDSAARVLCDVATLLDLRLTAEVPKDTLILSGLDKKSNHAITTESLIDSLCKYGDLKEVGIAKGQWFAVCRFACETGPLRALSAVGRGVFDIFGQTPKVNLVERPLLLRKKPDMIGRRAVSTPSVALAKPSLGRRRSHQRNTITMDSLMSQSPQILEVVKREVGVISPLSSPSVMHLYDADTRQQTATPGMNGPDSRCIEDAPKLPVVSPSPPNLDGILQPDFSSSL
mmetsp:Transcript_14090/g.33864  ORF Transcript_14090/g.33864 Transcript_14090/m.33864 type:complete len:693 (+) Transcript_14090:343-2421(+)